MLQSKILFISAVCALRFMGMPARAAQPLTNAQMDTVTAGYLIITTGNAGDLIVVTPFVTINLTTNSLRAGWTTLN
jgi:hypothetical protein